MPNWKNLSLKEPHKLKNVSETPLYWVDTCENLLASIAQIKQELLELPLLGVDLEYQDTLKQEGTTILSLVQLSTYCSDHIIDCFTLRNFLRVDNSLSDLF